MALELGVYSFGNTPRAADGGHNTAQAIRNVLEAVHVAEQAGLGFFGFGEHHTPSMPLSSPTSLVNAAAASTQRIGLGTTVTVLSTDDPLRVFEQMATAAAIAPGRVEVVAGRGSSDITFPLFDLDVRNYDMLYRSKLDLLIAANQHERVTWKGPHRQRPLTDALLVPRPEQPLKIWLGTAGHWAQYGTAYRQAWAEVGHPAERADIAVAVHGFVAADDRTAKATYLDHEMRMFATGAAEVGRAPMAPTGREANYERGGMVFAGGPNEIADRILHLHQLLGHSRQILEMDVGGMSHATFLKSIELLGTEVMPQIRKELEQQ